jgi:hypothetical protein
MTTTALVGLSPQSVDTILDQLTAAANARHLLARDRHNSHEARIRYEAAALAFEIARDMILREHR